VVLRGGSYGARGEITYLNAAGSASAPIRWVGQPGEKALIHGNVEVNGNYQRFCGLVFDGPTGPVNDSAEGNPGREQVKVQITGDHVELANSEVRGSLWHAGIFLAEANDVRIVGNYIHDNGDFGDPSQANLSHGIYWASGSGLVQGNRIEHNVAHAVQLYPRADGVTVRDNEMTGHGRAAVMLGEGVSNNQVLDNKIWNNRKGIEAYRLTGGGNVVSGNILWDNREGDLVGF
jgi:hypothetical protein